MDLSELVCQFCQRKLELPADYNRTYECVCGATYFVRGEWDDVSISPSEEAGLSEPVEARVLRGFDTLGDQEGDENGERQDMVFVRSVKPA